MCQAHPSLLGGQHPVARENAVFFLIGVSSPLPHQALDKDELTLMRQQDVTAPKRSALCARSSKPVEVSGTVG